MFTLTLAPQVSLRPALTVTAVGQTLIVCGDAIDLSPLEEGDILPVEAVDHPSIADKVRRKGWVIDVTLLFPIRADAPAAARFPAPITVTADGQVDLPPNGD
jgi:hypothetical protein